MTSEDQPRCAHRTLTFDGLCVDCGAQLDPPAPSPEEPTLEIGDWNDATSEKPRRTPVEQPEHLYGPSEEPKCESCGEPALWFDGTGWHCEPCYKDGFEPPTEETPGREARRLKGTRTGAHHAKSCARPVATRPRETKMPAPDRRLRIEVDSEGMLLVNEDNQDERFYIYWREMPKLTRAMAEHVVAHAQMRQRIKDSLAPKGDGNDN